MSDAAGDGVTPDQQPEAPDDLAKMRDALTRERELHQTAAKQAKANADAAKRLQSLEDAQKTEAERVADRISKAEAEVATVPARVADALRSHLVELHQIDKEDAELFLTANEPELLLKQVTRLVGQVSDRKKNGNIVPREGTTTTATEGDGRSLVRDLFGGN